MTALTPRQCDALSFIRDTIAARGVSPSYEEIGRAVNIASKSSVSRLVLGLEQRGAIRRIPNLKRTIELVEPVNQSDVLGFMDYDARSAVLRDAARRCVRPQALIAEIVRTHYFGVRKK